jgi:phosphonate transport system substrate-binding protein
MSIDVPHGATHAFSHPDRTSGYLVTASDPAKRDETSEQYFSPLTFTCGHRNGVRSVASGLTRSGNADG